MVSLYSSNLLSLQFILSLSLLFSPHHHRMYLPVSSTPRYTVYVCVCVFLSSLQPRIAVTLKAELTNLTDLKLEDPDSYRYNIKVCVPLSPVCELYSPYPPFLLTQEFFYIICVVIIPGQMLQLW